MFIKKKFFLTYYKEKHLTKAGVLSLVLLNTK